jgi:TolB-like protein/Tfp pilus assembly protein PilF
MASDVQAQTPSDAPPPTSGTAGVAQPDSPPLTSQGPGAIWGRIKRHKVVEWTLAYAAFGYALLHGVDMLSHAFAWPLAVFRTATFLLLLGMPLAATIAYYQGHRAQQRVGRLEILILSTLLVMAGGVLWLVSRETSGRVIGSIASASRMTNAATLAVFSPPPNSVAVLPFSNLSGDPKQDYFSDGMSEELINALSHIDSLEVIARTSSFSFKGQNVDVGTIARKLNVSSLLEGSVRRSGNTVRITAELVSAQSGFDLWSQTYDRNFSDILKVQTDVATAVVRQLQAKLFREVRTRIEVGGTTNAAAYDEYLRGEQERFKADSSLNESDYRAAVTHYDKSIALDPDYSMAYVGKAGALGAIAVFFASKSELLEVSSEARAAAERAVSLAPDLGEAHLALAQVLAYALLDFTAALPEYNRALELSPGSWRVQGSYGGFASLLGHVDDAISASSIAAHLDPENVNALVEMGQTLSRARHYGEALAAFRQASALDPTSDFIKSNVADVLLASGKTEQARQVCESLSSTPQGLASANWCLAVAYHYLGRQAEAQRKLEQLKTERGVDAADVAQIYAVWGQKAQALQWLNLAVQQRATGLQGLRVYWTLDSIRDDPEFRALERRLHFPP